MSRASDRINSALQKHNYAYLKKVGEGSFGAAILAQHSSDKDRDTKAIVKMIDISRASKQEREDAVKESQVLSSLKHPYIVRYRESFHEDGWLCIVMDYAEGGDLSDRIKKMRQANRSFPQEQVLRWFTQSILALKYIHDMHILHRDLKSGNFFLSKSGNIKMGDFGIAKVLECTAACAQTQIGTPYYLSPEICQGKSYAWGSDIWSMGCILYEMCARRVPFDAPDLKNLIQKITKGPAPEIPSEYSVGIRNLCKELLDRDPNMRPPAAEVLKRPVIQDMVKRMLEEVKGDENLGEKDMRQRHSDRGSDRDGGASAADGSSHAPPKTGDAGNYTRNEAVEYYSETHGEWLPASITNVDENGRIMLNVKPNVWLSLEVQSAKVRPKQDKSSENGKAPAPAGGSRPPAGPSAAAASPSQSGGDVRRRDASSGAQRQSSRDGIDRGGGIRAVGAQRQPSRDGGTRAASPRRDLGGRGSSPAQGRPSRGGNM